MWLSMSSVLPVVFGLVACALLILFLNPRLKALEKRSGTRFRSSLYALAALLLPLFLVLLFAPSLPVKAEVELVIRRLLSIAFILTLTWFLLRALFAGRDILLSRFDLTEKDNLRARAVHTQVNVLTKIVVFLLALIAGASVLMVFESVRQVGTSLLASAGVVGIIVGFAAQRSLATLLAGLQVAITQPIRIDDVVIIDGEWGQIEEITLTYVVVRIWDLRRLVVPIHQILEKSFQNWTRTTADLLGSVTLNVDYSLPVSVLRERLREILKENDLWDGKIWKVHVTGATERTVEVRALMSAANAADAWELRCYVREKLLEFLQQHYPECLPRLRAEVVGAGE